MRSDFHPHAVSLVDTTSLWSFPMAFESVVFGPGVWVYGAAETGRTTPAKAGGGRLNFKDAKYEIQILSK